MKSTSKLGKKNKKPKVTKRVKKDVTRLEDDLEEDEEAYSEAPPPSYLMGTIGAGTYVNRSKKAKAVKGIKRAKTGISEAKSLYHAKSFVDRTDDLFSELEAEEYAKNKNNKWLNMQKTVQL